LKSFKRFFVGLTKKTFSFLQVETLSTSLGCFFQLEKISKDMKVARTFHVCTSCFVKRNFPKSIQHEWSFVKGIFFPFLKIHSAGILTVQVSKEKRKAYAFFVFPWAPCRFFFTFAKHYTFYCVSMQSIPHQTQKLSPISIRWIRERCHFKKKKRKREGTRKKVCEMEINSFSLLFLSFSFSSFSFLRMR